MNRAAVLRLLNHLMNKILDPTDDRFVAGIDGASPGYKKIIIRPRPGGGLTWIEASYECPYGRIISNWKTGNGKINLEVNIPKQTTAIIDMPDS